MLDVCRCGDCRSPAGKGGFLFLVGSPPPFSLFLLSPYFYFSFLPLSYYILVYSHWHLLSSALLLAPNALQPGTSGSRLGWMIFLLSPRRTGGETARNCSLRQGVLAGRARVDLLCGAPAPGSLLLPRGSWLGSRFPPPAFGWVTDLTGVAWGGSWNVYYVWGRESGIGHC